MEFEKIFTDRLILRKLAPEDYRFIFENFPKQKIQEELGLHSDEEFWKEKQKFEQGYSMHNRSLVHFQLIEKNSNKILGGAGFHNWNPAHFRAELGYHLHAED
nr:GNAT family N-acetyltransferase [Saprospiraceae bacterium]